MAHPAVLQHRADSTPVATSTGPILVATRLYHAGRRYVSVRHHKDSRLNVPKSPKQRRAYSLMEGISGHPHTVRRDMIWRRLAVKKVGHHVHSCPIPPKSLSVSTNLAPRRRCSVFNSTQASRQESGNGKSSWRAATPAMQPCFIAKGEERLCVSSSATASSPTE